MPHPFPLASVFSGGMRRDVDRTEIPGGSAYNMVDFIPDEIQAVTGGRGGWTYAGPSHTGSTPVVAVAYHPDTQKLVSTDTSANLWDVVAGTTIATGFSSTQEPPTYHRGYLIFPRSGGLPGFYKSDGTTGTISGAPNGKFAGVYKDHAILAGDSFGSGLAQRVWFSAAGDPTTWDLSFGWWDTSDTVTSIIPLLNVILIGHPSSMERLRGTTPPPGSDMTLEPFLSVGVADNRSVAMWQQRAVFCSLQGIYMTDGATSVDLTAAAQMKTYWQSLMSNFSTTWTISGGVYRDHYIVSIVDGNGNAIDCLCVSLLSQSMWRFTNIKTFSFANVTRDSKEKLYAGQYSANRVIELSSLWSPSSTVKQDGDGTNPTPIVETGMFRGFDRLHRRWIESMGMQKWRWGYVDYDLRDAASDNPTAALSYCTTPTGSYTQAGATIPETTDISRVRRSLSPTQGGATRSQMLGLKFAVTGPYASAKLLTLEGAFEPIEIGAL